MNLHHAQRTEERGKSAGIVRRLGDAELKAI
jgi:hypothetical protein